MSILRLLSAFYIVFYIFILIIGSLTDIRIKKDYYILSFIFALCIGFWGFCLVPGRRLDLNRLYVYVQSLRFGNGSILSKIWGVKGNLGEISTEGMIGWNLICYIVQKTGNVHWLGAFGSFLTVFNVSYILVDYLHTENLSSKALGIGLLLSFMGLQLQYVFSGIRNTLAVSILVLSIYLFAYRRKSIIQSILLAFLAITIHPACIIALVPIIFVKFDNQLLWRCVALFTMPLIFTIARALQGITIPFLSMILNRILYYTNSEYQYDRPEMIANIIAFISIGFVYWYHKKRGLIKETKQQKLYMNAYYLLGMMMIGCSIHRDFTLRIGYIMGIAAFPVLSKILYTKYDNRAERYINYTMTLIVLIICGKVYYDTFTVLSQWNFG